MQKKKSHWGRVRRGQNKGHHQKKVLKLTKKWPLQFIARKYDCAAEGNCKRQTGPLVTKGTPQQQTRSCRSVIKIWSWTPVRCLTARETCRMTAGHNITLTLTLVNWDNWNSCFSLRGRCLYLRYRETRMSCSLQTTKRPHCSEFVMWALERKERKVNEGKNTCDLFLRKISEFLSKY